MSENTNTPGGAGNDPYNPNPYGQPQPGQNPYGQSPYGQAPYGQNPYGTPGAAGGGQGGSTGGYGQPTPGAPAPFSVIDAFKWGWAQFKAHWALFVPVLLVAAIASVAIGWIGDLVVANVGRTNVLDADIFGNPVYQLNFLGNVLTQVFQVASSVVSLIATAVLAKSALRIADGEFPTFTDGAKNIPWLQVVLLSILVSIGTSIGLVLCILPGLVFMFLTVFAQYFVLDRNVNAIKALVGSFRVTTRKFGDSALYALLAIAAVVVGALACCVGLLVAIPVVLLAGAYTFRVLGADVTTD